MRDWRLLWSPVASREVVSVVAGLPSLARNHAAGSCLRSQANLAVASFTAGGDLAVSRDDGSGISHAMLAVIRNRSLLRTMQRADAVVADAWMGGIEERFVAAVELAFARR